MGVLAPLTFSIQSSGQADAGATISITTALPALSGLIPEGSVAWLPVCEGQGGVDPAPNPITDEAQVPGENVETYS